MLMVQIEKGLDPFAHRLLIRCGDISTILVDDKCEFRGRGRRCVAVLVLDCCPVFFRPVVDSRPGQAGGRLPECVGSDFGGGLLGVASWGGPGESYWFFLQNQGNQLSFAHIQYH